MVRLANSCTDLLEYTNRWAVFLIICKWTQHLFFSITIFTTFGYLISLSLVIKVPETPIWLLSRHRDEEASKSLRWLRGWVSESEIEKELNDLKEYREFANSCSDCQALKIKCDHPLPSLLDKFKGLFQASYAKPMLIMAMSTFFTFFTAIYHFIPFLAQVLNTYETPVSPTNSMVRKFSI